jgi:V/A-type H+/Na+-transporting ATPase subunit I
MIVPMSRTYIVTRKVDQDRLLDRLGDLGLLHVEPVDPQRAIPDAATLQDMADLNRAIQILSPIHPRKGATVDQRPLNTAREVLSIEAGLREKQAQLKELYRQARELAMWGNVRIQQLSRLRKAGVLVRFFTVPVSRINDIEAECVEAVAALPDDRRLVAVISRRGTATMPEEAEPVQAPHRDRPSILAKAARVDAAIKQNSDRLSLLAGQMAALMRERETVAMSMAYETTRRSGLVAGDLFAVQGWIPSDEAERLASRIREVQIPAAVQIRQSLEQELPPTLIRYAPWARPIKALFDLLGALPGYREMDLSPFFMAALPLFAAMLIGDAGYGFCIALTALLFSKRIERAAGKEPVHLLVIFGLATLAWGVLTANYFGITPETLARAAGFVQTSDTGAQVDYHALWSGTGAYARTAQIMDWAAPLWRPDPEAQRFLIIKASLIVGCLHLMTAHIRRLVDLFPDQGAMAELGWIVAIGDMLVLIWHLLFVGASQVPSFVWWLLLGALLFPVWFGRPEKGVGRRVLFGMASSLLPLVGAFSDTMSYLRLFAVGMASYYIAMAFNMLGCRLAETATWVAAAPVLVFGHGLNIGLAAIAIFAHGIRLNMLEFSNNAGVQWGGYAYRPYALQQFDFAGDKRS